MMKDLNITINYYVQAAQVSDFPDDIKRAMLDLNDALAYAYHEYTQYRKAVNDGQISKPTTNDLTYLFAELDRAIKMLNITKDKARKCEKNLHQKNHLVATSYYLISLITRFKIKVSGNL